MPVFQTEIFVLGCARNSIEKNYIGGKIYIRADSQVVLEASETSRIN
jgi:hypothetical protein